MHSGSDDGTALPAPFSAGSQAPGIAVPGNACDCHMHIYDSRYPVAPEAALRPPDASVDQYRLLQRRIGTSRTVIVTPSTYGTDNRCMLDAMAQFGAAARGVAVVDTRITDHALEQLAGKGVRGIRFNLSRGAATTVEMIEPLAHRIRHLDWHIQLLMPPDQLAAIEALLQRLPTPIVFDHLGRLPAAAGTAHPAFNVIRRLLDRGRAWVKLSGAYLLSQEGPPRYADTLALGRALASAAPERMLWGSDWPHAVVSAGEKPMPNDADLLDLLREWAPDEATRRKILVDNPAALYGF